MNLVPSQYGVFVKYSEYLSLTAPEMKLPVTAVNTRRRWMNKSECEDFISFTCVQDGLLSTTAHSSVEKWIYAVEIAAPDPRKQAGMIRCDAIRLTETRRHWPLNNHL
ncbi:hypothetical protein ANCDUO_12336 [Ancylostoma duodenale]|uniref:Uncharacterized protein n=1 Tax=Ancylostoma duodenale TaxID=51022 RepID=A0A0C2D5U1_9BILA|nr:hypothetical protein ANCDUO_12336 [Ancylostoma duodenale]